MNNKDIVGGVERAAYNQLASLSQLGIEVKLFSQSTENDALPDPLEYFKGGLLKKVRNAFKYIYRSESQVKLRNEIKSFSPDIIHIHSFEGGLTNSIWRVLRNSSAKVYFTLHDYGLVCANHRLLSNGAICTKCINSTKLNSVFYRCNRNSLIFSMVNWLHQLVFDLNRVGSIVDVFIAPSNFIKSIYLKKYPDWKIEVLPNAAKIRLNERLLVNTERYDKFLFFGRLSAEKGLYEFLEAICELDLNFQFTIVGEGEDLIRLARFKADKRIKFLGKMTKGELDEIIEQHDWTVTPSVWYENFPYSIVESYEKLKPVLASSIGGMREMVDDGLTGFTFQYDSKIEKQNAFIKAINCSPSKYMNQQQKILDYLQEINESRVVSNLIVLYEFD